MKLNKAILILILIIFLALAFRMPAVLNSKSFWFDEVVSLEIAKKGVIESWQYLEWENNPPAHYIFLHFWVKMFGEAEQAVRLSSVLFSIFGIIAIYFLGKRLANRRIGLMAAFLFAFSSYQLFFAMEARMYPMLVFFSILSCYFFWELFDGNKNRLNWFLYLLFSCLAIYTHITALFLFIVHSLYFVYDYYFLKKKSVLLLEWIVAQLVVFFLFLPWLSVFVMRSVSSVNSGAWYLNTEGGGFFFWQLPRSFMFLGEKLHLIDASGMVIVGSLFLLALFKFTFFLKEKRVEMKLREGRALVFMLMLFLFPLFVGFFTQVWVAKYYTVGSIGFYLLLAMGLDNLNISKKFRFFLLILIFVILAPYNLWMVDKRSQNEWDKIARYVESIEKKGDVILSPAFVYKLPFDYYYRGDLEVIGYEPDGLESNFLLKAVKYNWYPVITEENMRDVGEVVGDAKRVLIIYPVVAANIHNAGIVMDWFWQNGWRLEDVEQFGGFVRPQLIVVTPPVNINE